MQVHGAQFSATRTLAQHFHETKFVQTLVPHRKTDGATCGLISRMDGAEINYRRLLMLIDEAGGGSRLVGAAIILFFLYLIGKYDISGLPSMLLTFGFAFAWESFVVHGGKDG